MLLRKAKPAIWEGDRNPLGPELLSAAAERGNYPEAKPNRDGLKGRRASGKRRVSSWRSREMSSNAVADT